VNSAVSKYSAFSVPAPVLRRLLRRDSAEMVTQLRGEIARRLDILLRHAAQHPHR